MASPYAHSGSGGAGDAIGGGYPSGGSSLQLELRGSGGGIPPLSPLDANKRRWRGDGHGHGFSGLYGGGENGTSEYNKNEIEESGRPGYYGGEELDLSPTNLEVHAMASASASAAAAAVGPSYSPAGQCAGAGGATFFHGDDGLDLSPSKTEQEQMNMQQQRNMQQQPMNMQGELYRYTPPPLVNSSVSGSSYGTTTHSSEGSSGTNLGSTHRMTSTGRKRRYRNDDQQGPMQQQQRGVYPYQNHSGQSFFSRYDNEYDDHHRHSHPHSSSSALVTPPEEVSVPSPSSYEPTDGRFWSYAMGEYANPRSCHERFGHSWPLTDRDRSVWTEGDFAIGRVLGSGNFGDVVLARSRDGGSSPYGSSSGDGGTAVFAIKTVPKSKILQSQSGIAIARREIEIQTRLRHPNVLGCEGYFHNRTSLFLVLEYANGRDLFDLFTKKQKMLADAKSRRQGGEDAQLHSDDDDDDDQYVATLPHTLAAHVTRQVAQALLYLQSKDVAHRDLKPENIMLHYPATTSGGSSPRNDPMNAQIKLCDFGWSCWCPFPTGHRHSTLCGTPEYIAPEILATEHSSKRPRLSTMVGNATSSGSPTGLNYDARYVDAWSLGVMIFELVSNTTPFRDDEISKDGENNEQIFAAIRRFDDDDLESLYVGRDVPFEWRQFGRIVRGLLRTNPMERLSMKQVLDHPWLKV